MPVLETPRLRLRRWSDGDWAEMTAINSDPDVMRWIGSGLTLTEEQTKKAIARWEDAWEQRGYGLFAVEVKETGRLAGFTGFAVPAFLPEVMPAVEIGWRLGRPFWGNGIATEAAAEALRFGREACGLTEVLSIVQIGNGASERIMQKLGMQLERETVDPNSGRPVKVYTTGTLNSKD